MIHLADYSPEFENQPIANILRQASKLVCITEDMKSIFEQTLGRNDIEVFFPESDGFFHLEFNDVLSNPDKQIKKILDYWEFPYDPNSTYSFPHLK